MSRSRASPAAPAFASGNDGASSGRWSSSFRAAAGDELLGALDDEPGVVFAVDESLVLQFVNRGWETFALANGGERCVDQYRVGTSIRNVVPEVLRPFYEAAFATGPIAGAPWEHVYECSSPDTFRTFRMRAVQLQDGAHWIVSNDLVHARGMAADASVLAADYVDEHRIVVQCSHCRRVRRVGTGSWDWVPSFVTAPHSKTSHSLCAACFAYHYPE